MNLIIYLPLSRLSRVQTRHFNSMNLGKLYRTDLFARLSSVTVGDGITRKSIIGKMYFYTACSNELSPVVLQFFR